MRCERKDANGGCAASELVVVGAPFVVSPPLRCLGGLDGWHGGVAACCCRQRVGYVITGYVRQGRRIQKLAALADDLDSVH